MNPRKLDDKMIDLLRREGMYSEATFSKYDVELYDRYCHRDIPFGGYRRWNPPRNGRAAAERIPKRATAFSADGTYVTRLGGFSRKGLYGPDETGKVLAEHHIKYVDTFVGYDPVETLMLCRKYGLTPYFYLPDCPTYLPGYVGVPLPFTKTEIRAYRPKYRREMRAFSEWIEKFGGMYGYDFKKAKDQIWILYTGIDLMPINLFEEAMKRSPAGVAAEFRKAHGFDLPLYRQPKTPRQKAERIKFWRWIRRRFEEVYRVRAEIFREEFPSGILVSNFHWTTTLDFVMHGETVDVVGINTRPMMLDNELGRRYVTGYAGRLIADLTQKPIMSAPRANLLAVSPGGLVAGKKAIDYCYNQAIQNGVWGFYIFFEDYSSGREEYDNDFAKVRESVLGLSKARKKEYCGPGLGNPDPTTLPVERWQTLLDVSRKVARVRRFIPPKSETGIFVSIESCSLGGTYWKRVFSAYVELRKAGVWTNFVSSDQIMSKKADLSRFKLLLLPVAVFENKKAIRALIRFVKNGGVLLSGDPRVFSFDENGNDAGAYRRDLFGVTRLIRRRRRGDPVSIEAYGAGISPYGACYGLELDGTARAFATYPDGTPAASEKTVGKGRAILFGSPIFDCYAHLRDGARKEDKRRYKFYKALEKDLGIPDNSWVWDVTLDNLERITGKVAVKKKKPDRSIVFRDFLLQHKR